MKRLFFALLLVSFVVGMPAYSAMVSITGSITDADTSAPVTGVEVGFVRVSALGTGAAGDPIPVDATVMSDTAGNFQLEVDDATPGLDQVLVFTGSYAHSNEVYDGAVFDGQIPTYADVAEPSVVELDFRAGGSGLDFALTATGGKTTYMVEMPDGIELATDVYLPSGTGPWPVVLYRTPYGKNTDFPSLSFLGYGYAIVSQDIRGCFDSGDIFRAFLDDGWGPDHQDGYDTAAWVRAQAWCDGDIVTMGGSARGISQNFLAGSYPEGLRAQHISVAASNMYTQAMFQGGAFRKAMAENWMDGRGAAARQFLEDEIKTRPFYNEEFWSYANPETRYPQVDWPIVNVGGWYDIFLQGTINNFTHIQNNGQPGAQGNQRLIIEPYGHGHGSGGFEWPANAGNPPAAYASSTAWFEHWVKGLDTGVTDQPPVCYYVLGDVDAPEGPGNEWRFADSWPPPATEVPFYLHPGGVLALDAPSDAKASYAYVYDPNDPVPTLGGANLTISRGPYDQQSLETRGDVAVFTTPVLDEYVEITGKVLVRLYASSSALDTDFTAKLCDVYPDGRSMLVCDGIVRARHRNTVEGEELLTPGAVYEFEIDLWEMCIAFNAGHRIRLDISSSNYPRFDANPNTGEPFNEDTYTVAATNTLYFDAARPSHVLFRVSGPDSDADGVANVGDAFPNRADEWADADEDGLGDNFEQSIIDFSTFDDIEDLADVLPGDDFDGDGSTNLYEFQEGWDPTDGVKIPAAQIPALLVGGGLLMAAALSVIRRGARSV
ncbi:MAG: CocE/NonD family hydrolase [Nitrospiraceae bacterium]|nr:CocE/NonD family hydrolase [Nitrospiraceae bacterium]